jgi:hypothetical protein
MIPFAIEKLISLRVKPYSKSSSIERFVISRIVTILTTVGLLIRLLRVALSIGILSLMTEKCEKKLLTYLPLLIIDCRKIYF